MRRALGIAILITLSITVPPCQAQSPQSPARPTPPARDPHTPGYVAARELPDGVNAPPDTDGNFIIGPTHNPALEATVQQGVPQGTIVEFTMNSADSRIYPGIAREPNTFGTTDPDDPAKLAVTTSHPAPYSRRVAVYVPKQYVPGQIAPFIVGADGPDRLLFTTLDNLISHHRVPVMIAISISNGSGDAQGSERGLEYDTMSGRYAEFVETEVLPRVESQAHVKLTKDPDGRATMGGSSGGSCALIMAWYHPELYHRVLTYSGTYVNQQWPYNPQTPHGAWEFHEHLIPSTPGKPLRIWMEVGDRDLLNPNVMHDGMHDWVLANENMARVLADKGYHYQFVYARNAGHTDHTVKEQTLPEALEYLWHDYAIPAAKVGSPWPRDTGRGALGISGPILCPPGEYFWMPTNLPELSNRPHTDEYRKPYCPATAVCDMQAGLLNPWSMSKTVRGMQRKRTIHLRFRNRVNRVSRVGFSGGPMGKTNSLPPSGHYNANYGNFQTELYAQIRREAFGEDIGQNSWLTSDEQDRFLEWLDLSPGKTLLDVACGAGGPALRIAATTGCSVVGIDILEQAVTTATSLAAQLGLSERAEFRSTDATGPLPFPDASFDAITCIDGINHLPDRYRVITEWARLLRPSGRLLFTDPIILTGPLTSADIAVRSSAGSYLFVPHGYDGSVIAQCGLRLLVCQDVTANMAKVAEARRSARASRSADLRDIEGDKAYEGQQEFLAVAARVAREGRLSRFVYVSTKLS